MNKRINIVHLRFVVKQAWHKYLRKCTVEPITNQITNTQAACLVHCYFLQDGLYTRGHLEQVKERLNAFDYTIRVTPASLLVTYYVRQK